MPLFCVEVKFRSPETESESLHPEDTEAVSSLISPELSLYDCPLCVDAEPESEREQIIANDRIIATIPLLTKIPPVLCRLRRVKIVSVL